MAIAHIEFGAETLQMRTRVNVLMPEHPDHPAVLLLLHGLGDDENVWLEQTRLAAYVGDAQIVVIMPRVDRSYYANNPAGVRYFDYIADELLARCADWLHLDLDPARTFVAGLSMGGFGAMKVGLNRPRKFRAIFAMSGSLDQASQWTPERDAWYQQLYGTPAQFAASNSNLFGLLKGWDEQLPKPVLYQICGTADAYFPMNQRFLAQAQAAGFTDSLQGVPGGHEWAVWDGAIPTVLHEIQQLVK